MPLPLKLLNRLRLGRDLAARVPATLADHVAWVYVYPLPDYLHSILLLEAGREGRLRSTNGDPVRGFLVRYVEAPKGILDRLRSFQLLERDFPGFPPVERRLEVRTEEELAAVLKEFVENPLQLHEPSATGYCFRLGPELLDAEEQLTYKAWFDAAERIEAGNRW